jgi:hypothetical protein
MGLIWTNVLHGGYPQESGRYYVKMLSSPIFKVGGELEYSPKLYTSVEHFFTENEGREGAGFYIDGYWEKWQDGLIVYWAKVDDGIELIREDAEALYKKYFLHKKEGDSNGGF